MAHHWIAGIDLGGTKLSLILARADGNMVRRRVPVVRSGADTAIPQQAWNVLQQLCSEQNIQLQQLGAVGFSSCGPFITREGFRAVAAPNLCGGLSNNPWRFENTWSSIPIEQFFRQHLPAGVAFALENDGIAALHAECSLGSVPQEMLANCAYATWSTGLGFAVCVDGKILRGKSGNAGHFGHSFIAADNAAPCGCGSVGDAEAYLAGNGLAQSWGASVEEVFARAKAGDVVAQQKIAHAVQHYSFLLFNIVVSLDISCILLGGSIFLHNQEILLPQLQKALTAAPRSGMAGMTKEVVLRPASLGLAVADLGALSLVLPEEWGWKQQRPWQGWE